MGTDRHKLGNSRVPVLHNAAIHTAHHGAIAWNWWPAFCSGHSALYQRHIDLCRRGFITVPAVTSQRALLWSVRARWLRQLLLAGSCTVQGARAARWLALITVALKPRLPWSKSRSPTVGVLWRNFLHYDFGTKYQREVPSFLEILYLKYSVVQVKRDCMQNFTSNRAAISIQYRRVTDRQTDTLRQHSVELVKRIVKTHVYDVRQR